MKNPEYKFGSFFLTTRYLTDGRNQLQIAGRLQNNQLVKLHGSNKIRKSIKNAYVQVDCTIPLKTSTGKIKVGRNRVALYPTPKGHDKVIYESAKRKLEDFYLSTKNGDFLESLQTKTKRGKSSAKPASLRSPLEEIQHIIEFQKGNNRSYAYMYQKLLQFNQYFLGHSKLEYTDLTYEFAAEFQIFLLKQAKDPSNKLGRNGAIIYTERLKFVCKELLKKRKIKEDPFFGVKIEKKAEPETYYLTQDQCRKLASTGKAINSEVRLAFLFVLQTGVRWSDLKRLQHKHIHMKEGILHFEVKKTARRLKIHLSRTAKAIIRATGRSEGLLFHLPTRAHFNNLLRKWAKEAGIKGKISCHVGRHTIATNLVSNGVDIFTVKELLGHKSIVPTTRYLSMTPEMNEIVKNKFQELIPVIGA